LNGNRKSLGTANGDYKVKCVDEIRDNNSSHPDGSAMPPTHNGPSLFSIRPAVYAPESFILALLNPIYACLHGDDHELALAPWRLEATALGCS
jgi:hypothetical protein